MEHIKKIAEGLLSKAEQSKNLTEQQHTMEHQLRTHPVERIRFEHAKKVFWQHARHRAQHEGKLEFVMDEQNRDAVRAFVAWITGDVQTMNEYGMDERKGLLVRGNVGSGKSILFRIWSDCIQDEANSRYFRKFVMTTCEKVAKQYAKGGDKFIEKYGEMAVHFNPGSYRADKYVRHVFCFDDLGNEEAKNHYGNFKEVMVDVISQRYDWMLSPQHLTSHFTTNLTWSEISTRYGARVESRLRQMCNLIDIGANPEYKDRRKV